MPVLAVARRLAMEPHPVPGIPQGLIGKSKKLILDDENRVQKVYDKGESFRLQKDKERRKRESKYNQLSRVDDKSDCESLTDAIAEQLDQAKVSYPLNPDKSFIPQPDFDRIFTFECVLRIVSTLNCLSYHTNKHQLAGEIYHGNDSSGPSVKLLAVLIGLDKVDDFAQHMLVDGMRDSCLPLRKDTADGKQILTCQKHGNHKTINSYRRSDCRERFLHWAYSVTAPLIKWESSRHSHYVLDTGDILPMDIIDKVDEGDSTSSQTETAPKSSSGNTYGGFSEVYKVKIHDGHWDFGDHGIRHPQGFFALKKLTSHKRNNFNLELSSLLFTGNNYQKKHLIQLLATFEVVNLASSELTTYYFLFDWAEGSLTKFWQNNPTLVRNKEHCLWMSKQFYEISEALQCVHNDRAPTLRYLEDRQSNEALYGRHGDIKPDNFLWFKDASSSPGLLVLSDFGLGRLHTQVSRSAQDPKYLERSASYRSPEFDLQTGLVSPRSDIFSLGCVFLEYVTWFLLGFDVVEQEFPEKRMEIDIYTFKSDTFFSIRNHRPYLKAAVSEWIQQLQNSADCSWYLFDLLDVIKHKMLDPNSSTRMPANQLTKRMNELWRACEDDPDYYLKPRH
ncbi:protein kinase domain-containing protein [Colletotrichum truncatum]|uniref:Protein kinase domain-containing protein n=1 Tax=Colletotrichum truncatum TaxID=5467 RepID=A0ACC3ZD83_COLTU|nr:protein kinase domain-containing protein [Colletotrichum truncatum]KAF6798039.1 protein kinase domain-containing protein [Colletotrichum truncatum]